MDTSFPADDTSIFWKDAYEDDWGTAADGIEWRRIRDVYGDGTYTLFGSNGVTPKDIFQGAVGNCWFLTALSAIAEKPNRVERMFLNSGNAINPSGLYGINMYALGLPHTVLVDDLIAGSQVDGKF